MPVVFGATLYFARAPHESVKKKFAEASVTSLLQDYVISGKPRYIIDAVAECGRLGIAPPPDLLRALPILAGELKRPGGLKPQNLERLRRVFAIHSVRKVLRDAGHEPIGPEPASYAALRRYVDTWNGEIDARNASRRAIAKKKQAPPPDLPHLTLHAIWAVFRRWREVYNTGAPEKRATRLKKPPK